MRIPSMDILTETMQIYTPVDGGQRSSIAVIMGTFWTLYRLGISIALPVESTIAVDLRYLKRPSELLAQ